MLKTIVLTSLALLAFAANSVLCRMALGDAVIDAASFTVLRLLSGMLVLWLILALRSKINSKASSNRGKGQGGWFSALMLFCYATCFSFAYISLDTATGALVLFGAVQITMMIIQMISGHKLHASEWLGLLLAFAGFVYLLLPNLSAPSLSGFMLMAAAGVAWGFYTIKGKGSMNPLADTTLNFTRTLPLIIVLFIVFFVDMQLSYEGVVLALLSGALASGLGYTLWYMALGGLSVTEAAVVQLLVPVIAALGGLVFVSELISMRWAISAAMVLGGILIVVLSKNGQIQKHSPAVPAHPCTHGIRASCPSQVTRSTQSKDKI